MCKNANHISTLIEYLIFDNNTNVLSWKEKTNCIVCQTDSALFSRIRGLSCVTSVQPVQPPKCEKCLNFFFMW